MLRTPVRHVVATILFVVSSSCALAQGSGPSPASSAATGANAARPPSGGVPASAPSAASRRDSADYPLGPGDVVRISVFQHPDLSIETRISESGKVSYPLLGSVQVGGLSAGQAEQLIARGLESGGFLRSPQVSVNVAQYRSQQVSVLGNVNRPGRYPIDTQAMRLSEVLALAGGVSENGGDSVVVTTMLDGKPRRVEVDLAEIFVSGDFSKDLAIRSGDAVYVHRAPVFYVYGQVQRPGMYVVDRGMTLAQAIAKGGGLTLRGTDRGIRLHRRNARGEIDVAEPKLDEQVRPSDLIFVRESLF